MFFFFLKVKKGSEASEDIFYLKEEKKPFTRTITNLETQIECEKVNNEQRMKITNFF